MASLRPEQFNIIKANQCPLPPRKYSYIDKDNKQRRTAKRVTAFYFQGDFWFQEPDTEHIYVAIKEPAKDFKRYEQRLNDMRAVDTYLSTFKLTTSAQIYQRLASAMLFDANSAKSIGSRQETIITIDAEKFRPTWKNRLSFWTVIFRAILNAYFIITNFVYIEEVPANFRVFVLVVVCIEAVIWLLAFVRCLYNVWSLLHRICRGDTTHFQTKNIPDHLSQLASISVMRYLPNGESISMFKKRGCEWFNEKYADFTFQRDHAQFKWLVIIRWIILTVLDVIGPFVAVFSLLFKMAQLNFNFDVLLQWQWTQIISYFAFVNQVAGIRKVREIEIDALQHFIFSGSDAVLSRQERTLLNCWWNLTIVSCVANICDAYRFPIYDSMVFWYTLDVYRIQLLFKNHQSEGADVLNESFNHKYDEDMQQKMQQHIENNRDEKAIETLPTDSALDEANIEAVVHVADSDEQKEEED
mmetsp:Transcript_33428/g.53545  ORF Transcript_33428/g.53545 Transcript_33428/m.53545 type:complete len:470 (+) Transcript_33428:20-1429(+)|eukprot:CAMPEP_0197035262 /NCGR_PEP_ID=MMETSP1384-20130603/13117_1 /TAXON_ID=29189 /ORGANISM="Ammonia sp." /LENGTH=469 /DNA_ID=CAMNT_0042465305 /DNA_START=18 /DNA_END=1427 /DNA_ORIENTATION=+